MIASKVSALFAIYLVFERAPLQHSEAARWPTKIKPTFQTQTAADEPCAERASRTTPVRGCGNKELVPVLNIALLSASVGKYFLNRRKNISTECHETAMTVVELWQRLPIVEHVDQLIQDAYQDVVSGVRPFEALRNPVASVCDKIQKRFADDAALSAEFWRLKESLRRGGINKAYTNVTDAPKTNDKANQLIVEEFDDPIIGQLLAHIAFVNQLKAPETACLEYRTWAKAILRLAEDDRLSGVVQALYDRTRLETSSSIVSPPNKRAPANSIMRLFETEMMKNLKRNLENDAALTTDFQTAVKGLQQRECATN